MFDNFAWSEIERQKAARRAKRMDALSNPSMRAIFKKSEISGLTGFAFLFPVTNPFT